MAGLKTGLAYSGAERKIVFLGVTKPVIINQADVNVTAYISTKKDIKEQVITDIKDLKEVTTGELLYEKIQAHFIAYPGQRTVIYGKNCTKDEDYTEILNEIVAGYFSIVSDEDTLDKCILIGETAAANAKVYGFTPKFKVGEDGADTYVADIKKALEAVKLQNVFCIPSKNDSTADAKVIGAMIPRTPGKYSWVNKMINGAVDGGFTGAEQTQLEAANCSYFAKSKGQILLAKGVNVLNEPGDFIHCMYALQFRIEEDVTQYMASAEKTTFTNTSELKTVITTRTTQFENTGALVIGQTSVKIPKAADIPVNDKLNGVLDNVEVDVMYEYAYGILKATLNFKA